MNTTTAAPAGSAQIVSTVRVARHVPLGALAGRDTDRPACTTSDGEFNSSL